MPIFNKNTTKENDIFESSVYSQMSEIDCYKNLVDIFIHLYEDELYDMMSQKLMKEFRVDFENLKRLYNSDVKGKYSMESYEDTIEDATDIIDKIVTIEYL